MPKSLGVTWPWLWPLFEKFLRGHVRTVPGNMNVKFEVCSFNRFKLVWLTGLLRTDAHTDTHNEQKHLAEIIKLLLWSTSLQKINNDWNRKYLGHSPTVYTEVGLSQRELNCTNTIGQHHTTCHTTKLTATQNTLGHVNTCRCLFIDFWMMYQLFYMLHSQQF